MKSVIFSILAIGLGLAALGGAYKLGQASNSRYEFKDSLQVDKQTGRMWYLEDDHRLFEYKKSAFSEVPKEVIDSLIVKPLPPDSSSNPAINLAVYNPSKWRLRNLRVKVTKIGTTPEENWARIYASETYIPAEGQESFTVGAYGEPVDSLKMEIISGQGYLTDSP